MEALFCYSGERVISQRHVDGGGGGGGGGGAGPGTGFKFLLSPSRGVLCEAQHARGQRIGPRKSDKGFEQGKPTSDEDELVK